MTDRLPLRRLTFRSGGRVCAATLFGCGDEPRPCVVLCPGFGGTQDTPALRATAQQFARAGYVAMTFDYRNFGESEGQPRQLVDIEGQLRDIAEAVDCARADGAVDSRRIVLWGTSLGGGHVVVAAARDAAIAAVVAQVPFNGFPKKEEGRSTAAVRKLLTAMAVDQVRGWLRLSPAYVKSVGAPGELAVMATEQAMQTIEGMQSATWVNRVAPRALFEMMRYRPADWAPRLEAPLLVCMGEADKEVAAADIKALAHAARRAELLAYPFAHFDFYRDGVRQAVVADQLAFLDRVLGR